MQEMGKKLQAINESRAAAVQKSIPIEDIGSACLHRRDSLPIW